MLKLLVLTATASLGGAAPVDPAVLGSHARTLEGQGPAALSVLPDAGPSASLSALGPVSIATAAPANASHAAVRPVGASSRSPAEIRAIARGQGFCDLLLCTDASGKGNATVLSVPTAIFTGAPVDPNASYQLRTLNVSSDGETWWTRNPQEIPLPPGTWSGIAGLFTVAGFGIIRRRRLRLE